MFNIKSIHNYISKLSASSMTPESIKKLNSIELFLDWLKKKRVINSNEFSSLKTKIVSLRAVTEEKNTNVDKLTIVASSSPIAALKKPNRRSLFKTIFISLNLFILLVSIFYFKKDSFSAKPSVNAKDSGRVLHYKGRLIDVEGKPIDSKRDVVFKLYDNASTSVPIYTGGCVGQYGLVPEYNGSFKVLIGEDCRMKRIPSSLFTSAHDLYLGITIGSDKEMSPRQKIAKSSYALEADKLKGMTLGASTSSIPYIDSNGRLLIDATTPTLRASSGMFTIEGESITIQTLSKESGSIYLLPLENTIIGSGNVGIGTMTPNAKLDVAGDASISGNLFFTNKDTQIAQFNGGNITFSTSTAGMDQLTPGMTIYNGGNVQIGEGAGQYPLSVRSNRRASASASFSNTSIEDNLDTSVMKLNLSTPTNGSLSRFIQFYANSTSDKEGTAVGRIRLNNGNVAYETGGADFAEYFEVQEEVNAGDIIAATERGNVKAREGESIIGVVSDTAGFIGNANEDNGDKKIVGLVGQIETNVSTINGEINVGTSIALNNIPGYGARAIKTGDTVGRALQSLKHNGGFSNYNCPIDSQNRKDPNGNPIVCGKIKVLVQKGWYDANLNLTGDKIIIDKLGSTKPYMSDTSFQEVKSFLANQQYVISSGNNSVSNIISAFEVITAKIRVGYLNAQNVVVEGILTANSLVVQDIKAAFIYAKNISTEKITAVDAQIESLTAKEVTSPIVTAEKIKTKTLTAKSINTQSDSIEIDLEKKSSDDSTELQAKNKFAELLIKGFDNKTVASIDAAGNATFSGDLTAETVSTDQLLAQEATISGDLYARNITSDNISSLENTVSELQQKISSNTNSSQNSILESEINRVKAELEKIKDQKLPDPKYYQTIDKADLLIEDVKKTLAAAEPEDKEIDNLTVSSTANLFNATISNNLVVGQLFVKENSLLSLAADLNISALEKINFFNSSIVMSKEGSIVASGSITAQGGVKTSSIQSTDKNLEVQFGSESDDVKNGKVSFMNSKQEEVSSINEQGEAQFSKISLKNTAQKSPSVMTPADNFQRNGLFTSAIETGYSSAGVGVMPGSTEEVVVYNDTLSEESLVYLTSTSNGGAGLSVIEKKVCSDVEIENRVCKPYFKVIADTQTASELSFNWLVIN